jgi:hypothetical protein
MPVVSHEEQLQADLVERVVELGFDEVWQIPAPVALAWMRHVLGDGFSAEDITRDVLLNTLTDYIGQFDSAVTVLKTAAQQAYPKISFERFPFSHIDWDAAAKVYMEHGVLVVGDGHYFDRDHNAFSLEDII